MGVSHVANCWHALSRVWMCEASDIFRTKHPLPPPPGEFLTKIRSRQTALFSITYRQLLTKCFDITWYTRETPDRKEMLVSIMFMQAVKPNTVTREHSSQACMKYLLIQLSAWQHHCGIWWSFHVLVSDDPHFFFSPWGSAIHPFAVP